MFIHSVTTVLNPASKSGFRFLACLTLALLLISHSNWAQATGVDLVRLGPLDQDSVFTAVSADGASQAMARGARVIDVRSALAFAQGHLPGAVSMPVLAGHLPKRAELGQAVSQGGVDLSREVVLVGELGDEHVQRLRTHMAQFASGRVVWLVGGVDEWAMTGRSIANGSDTQSVALALPLPQNLVSFAARASESDAGSGLAGATRRSVARHVFASSLQPLSALGQHQATVLAWSR